MEGWKRGTGGGARGKEERGEDGGGEKEAGRDGKVCRGMQGKNKRQKQEEGNMKDGEGRDDVDGEDEGRCAQVK